MPKINVDTQEKPVDEVKVENQAEAEIKEEVVEKTAKSKKVNSEEVEKTVKFLESKGEEGATAFEIAVHLGKLEANADPTDSDAKSACRHVRVIARAAVDNHDNGKRDVRKGKNKLYQIMG